MSLERFSNKEEILETNGVTRGIIWNAEDIDSLVLDTKTVTPNSTPIVEIHVYATSGDYITSTIATDFVVRDSKLYINYAKSLNDLGIRRGLFEVVVNVFENRIGSTDDQLLQIKEISPDRREMLVRLVPLPEEVRSQYTGVVDDYLTEYANAYTEDLAVNFGSNNVIKIINQKDWDGEEDMVMRLYKPLPDSVNLNDTFWIVEELADSYVDNVDLSIPLPTPQLNNLRGPNFDIDSNYSTITETEFKNWNSLLDANLSTSQQIIDSYFSGSLAGIQLGIDYTAFDSFVFYSSAAERLANFKYKLEMVEFYNDRLSVLNNASGSNSGSLTNNVTLTQQRIDNVIGSFDAFERWLYNEPTSSLSTHGVSGSFIGADGYALTPWPKYLSGSKYYVHHTTSSLGTMWFDGFYATASFYDEQNPNALTKTIPEHIRNDVNNDQYELFVNMIGHHFDILYTYVNALTATYRPEEQPKLGASRETLYEIAKSMGWTLANGNQASSLWKYKLGTNTSGSYQTTGSLFSKTDEDITTEVWRRIVNNLPYLLKTKGTERSVKALMSCYGIPQTLLSIREYGGPKVEENVPTLIEDRYSYVLRHYTNVVVDAAYKVAIPGDNVYSSSIGDWGIRRGNTAGTIAPMTREFRFGAKPGTGANSILATVQSRYNASPQLNTIHAVILLESTGSYSGSNEYGRIIYAHAGSTTYNSSTVSVASTDWLPLFDGDMWNIRWWWETGANHFNTGSNSNTTYRIQVQKASDYINGKIIHSGSLSIKPTAVTHFSNWAPSDNAVVLGSKFGIGTDVLGVAAAITSSFPSINWSKVFSFNGYFQEYREWLETLTQDAFDDHTLNPTSYVSGLSPTSSYDTLIRHFPLGSDTIARSHAAGTEINSSHPFNSVMNFGSTLYGTSKIAISSGTETDPELGPYLGITETYYVPGVSLGGSLPRSEKIRLEDNYLIRRLSPTNTAERSSFDYAPIDTNRVGLFYSHADQINKDIFNQIGDIALDDFVGDPNDEFGYQYPDLFHFSKNYWKKYTDRNDVNAYIRIFSQFDFSLFNQIKQLLPARVDEAMGLLIEPHALERVKVPLTKRPVIENPQYDVTLTQSQPTASGEYIMYSASIAPVANLLQVESVYHTGSNGYSDLGNTWFANMNVGPTRNAMDYCIIEINPVDALPSATASLFSAFSKDTVAFTSYNWKLWTSGSNVSNTLFDTLPFNSRVSRINSVNNLGIWHFLEESTVSSIIYTDPLYAQFSTSTPYDISTNIDIDITRCLYLNTVYDIIDATLLTRSTLVILNSSDAIETVISEQTHTSYITTAIETDTITFNDILIPANTRIAVIFEFALQNVAGGTLAAFTIDAISSILSVKEVCHSATMPIIESYRPSDIYQQIVYHYSGSKGTTLRDRNAYHAYSQSLGLYYSQSLIPATYMDDQFDQYENARYNGCRISSPDFNVNSTVSAIGNSPVVEVYNTNPNQLIFTQNPESRGSTGATEPGNLVVR
jgi:hypothetical protein